MNTLFCHLNLICLLRSYITYKIRKYLRVILLGYQIFFYFLWAYLYLWGFYKFLKIIYQRANILFFYFFKLRFSHNLRLHYLGISLNNFFIFGVSFQLLNMSLPSQKEILFHFPNLDVLIKRFELLNYLFFLKQRIYRKDIGNMFKVIFKLLEKRWIHFLKFFMMFKTKNMGKTKLRWSCFMFFKKKSQILKSLTCELFLFLKSKNKFLIIVLKKYILNSV